MIRGYVREATSRDFPSHPRPKGYRLVIVDELTRDRLGALGWRHLTKALRPCRWTVGPGYKQCGAPAVVELMRGQQPWGYCPKHLFGRRWLGGHLEGAILVNENEVA